MDFIDIRVGTQVDVVLKDYKFRAAKIGSATARINGFDELSINMEDMKDHIPYWRMTFTIPATELYKPGWCLIDQVRICAPDPNDDSDRIAFLLEQGNYKFSGRYEFVDNKILVNIDDFESNPILVRMPAE
jgi:hypothetical protein